MHLCAALLSRPSHRCYLILPQSHSHSGCHSLYDSHSHYTLRCYTALYAQAYCTGEEGCVPAADRFNAFHRQQHGVVIRCNRFQYRLFAYRSPSLRLPRLEGAFKCWP